MANKTLVFSFGRMSPPTAGHEKLVDKLNAVAKAEKGKAALYVSHSFDKKKNPLQYADKLRFLQQAFGPIVTKSDAKTAFAVAEEAYKAGYKRLIMVVGSDRVANFQTELSKYNAPDKLFNFDELKVVSAGERDPDADDVSGMSASKMRAAAAAGDFTAFKNGLPKKLQTHAKEVYDMTQKGMGLTEEVELTEGEPLTLAQRRARGRVMRQYKSKLKQARARARLRKATDDKLKTRARKNARNIIRSKVSGGKGYGEMTPAEKIQVDKRIARIPQAVFDRISRKKMPELRRAELDRVAHLHDKHESVQTLEEAFANFLEGRMRNPSATGAFLRGEAEKKANDLGNGYAAKWSSARGRWTVTKDGKRVPGSPELQGGRQAAVAWHKENILSKETVSEERTSFDGTPPKKHHELLKKDGAVKLDKRFKMFSDKKQRVPHHFGEEAELMAAVEELAEAEAKKAAVKAAVKKKAADKAAPKTGSPHHEALIKAGYEPVSKHGKLGQTGPSVYYVHKDSGHKIQVEKQHTTHYVWAHNNDKYGSSRMFQDAKGAIAHGKAVQRAEVKECASNDPKDREFGTDKLTKILKSATPGETCGCHAPVTEEVIPNHFPNIKKGDRVSFVSKKVHKTDDHHGSGIVVATTVRGIKIRDDEGKVHGVTYARQSDGYIFHDHGKTGPVNRTIAKNPSTEDD